VICDERPQFLDLNTEMEDMFDVTFKKSQSYGSSTSALFHSPAGINIDQTDHIFKTIVEPYFKDRYTSNLLSITSPFPTDASFEQHLYEASVLTGSALPDV
jgi:hypothetical protein